MNMLHMKYAIEVAKHGSINKAAEALLMNQPNLSRAIKELEASLGIKIFVRSARGMLVTPEGEIFLSYAGKILKQVDELEEIFKEKETVKKRFSISVPRASYISEAFSNFSLLLNNETDAEIFYKETNSQRTINNILKNDYNLGIVRYEKHFDKYYKAMLEEKELHYEPVTEFRYVLLINSDSPLAQLENITYDDLKSYTELAHADPFVPSLPFAEVKKEELPDYIAKRIFVFERASQFELLANNKETFMWVSPIPEKLLSRYGLVQRICKENKRIYKDILIRRKAYKMSELDNLFLSELCKSKNKIKGWQ